MATFALNKIILAKKLQGLNHPKFCCNNTYIRWNAFVQNRRNSFAMHSYDFQAKVVQSKSWLSERRLTMKPCTSLISKVWFKLQKYTKIRSRGVSEGINNLCKK